MSDEALREIETLTRRWVENIVIGMNLCPFAKGVYVKDQVKIHITPTQDLSEISQVLTELLSELATVPAEQIDTTLLVLPFAFESFYAFNDYLDVADQILDALNLMGEIQIANFHPQYQFAGTQVDDMSNYTNRSPYPILHLIREDSIDRAVSQFPDAAVIFERNIAMMEELGLDGWHKLLKP
ncbi:MAG: DUF1415 domain-containing protein [Pelistega sp.]|nr:DUF1415 domain-containing protein [Pelistega sp.]